MPYKGTLNSKSVGGVTSNLPNEQGNISASMLQEVKQGEYLGFDIASGRPKLGEPAENREDLPDVGLSCLF